MAYQSLRDWIEELDKAGLLKRITAKVDWDLEIGAINRRVGDQEGPALLFENIKDYENTTCRKLFVNGLGSRERVAMAFNLPRDTSHRDIVKHIKGKLGRHIDPVKVESGPVKKNIIKGDAVNLYEFPTPRNQIIREALKKSSHQTLSILTIRG